MAQQHADALRSDAHRSLQKAVEFAWNCQQPDGHWVAPVSADATFTAQYVMFKYQIPGLSLDEDGPAIKQWLLSDQTSDGSWVLAPGLPGNVSTTVEAYLALRLLGTSVSHPAMLRARDFVLSKGGVARVRFFTRFFLATFGLFPWTAVPQMPAELILLPTWFFLNIYVLSSWSRSTLIPVLVARHHEPIYALPNGRSPNNAFLDELWCNPGNKHVPVGPPLWELMLGRKRDLVAFIFTLLDKILAMLGGLRWWPLRRYALDKCIEWLIEHQEESGDWAGFFPPIHGSIWALILQGFPLHCKQVRLGLEALERLAINDNSGKWLQSTISPQWDTALMLNALCDAGYRDDPRVVKAAAWLRDMQLIVPYGDWRIYANTQQAGGWSFQYYNTFYPDVDDAAVVVMGLVKQDPGCINSDCISNAIEWILGMQNRDGGWGAFDINNDARWLHKIPFSDMDSLIDPATADVTGRILECFGMLLAHRESSRLCLCMARRLEYAAERAMVFLQKEQESSGAAAGSWWGRWGSNYNYGTGNVLRGLVWFASSNPVARDCAERAVLWFEKCQNQDGGWGETLLSYMDPGLAGCGESNAAQTAWALDCLLRFRPPTDLAVRRGTQWLTANQTENAENGRGARWRCDDIYVGTGFPDVLYLGYPFYHLHFPISALARYLETTSPHAHAVISSGVQLAPNLATDSNCSSVLIMAMGSRGDLMVFLNIAKRLHGWRIRIATHPCHRSIVEAYGFEYYNVGGSPYEFSNTLGNEDGVLQSIMRGKLRRLRGSLCQTYAMFWRASFDNDGAFITESSAKTSRRPFVADMIVAGAATSVHIHAAEKLHIPLVIVSPQPAMSTSEFPHPLTMSKPLLNSRAWWNIASYYCLDLAIWAAFGRFINRLRVQEYGMRPWSWLLATRYLHCAGIPNVCMWSSHVLATPKDWKGHIIAGYSWSTDEAEFEPHGNLHQFLDTDKPLLAVSLGSATVRDPVKLLETLSLVSETLSIRSVICRSWPITVEKGLQLSSALYITDYVPHSWLLPRVHGFMHHGGAGHTAAGMRAGTPMLVMPHFLDQYFWAAKVAEQGLGPPAVDRCQLTALRLQASLEQLLSGRYSTTCAWMANQLCAEGDGAKVAAEVIVHQASSPALNVPCSVVPSVVAHWRHEDTGLALSSAAVSCLVSREILGHADVELLPRIDWTSRLQEANQPSKSTASFITILACMRVLFDMLQLLTGWHVSFEAENKHAKVLHDPIRQAKMKQGLYDVQVMKQQITNEEWWKFEEDIIARWQTLAAAAFHAHFGRAEAAEVQAVDVVAVCKAPYRSRRDSKLE